MIETEHDEDNLRQNVISNKARKSRKRKRTASDANLWADVHRNIVSKSKAHCSTSQPSHDVPDLFNDDISESELHSKRQKVNMKHHKRILDFNKEIVRTVDSVSVLDAEVDITVKIILNDLEKTVKNKVPEHKWHYFGSYLNGLGCKDSDIDFYFESLVDTPYYLPKKIEKLIRSRPKSFHKIVFIKHARVPVIKLIHTNTGKECDISFTSEVGVRNSMLTRLLIKLNPSIKNLTLYLKFILKKYGLQGTGKITTYILSWLVGYFMQQKKLLPAVIDIRKAVSEKYFVSGWDCSIPEHYSYSVHDSSCLYTLLMDFLKFYNEFDFLKNVICPYLACCFPICDFESYILPNEVFSGYLQKVQNNEVNSFSRHVINIQDPSDLSFNLAKQVDIKIANKFKILCFYLCRLLPDCNSNTSTFCQSLNKMLPSRLPDGNYQPRNLSQYLSTYFDCNTLSGDCLKNFDRKGISYIGKGVRKMMETVFALKLKSISNCDVNRTVFDKQIATQIVTPVSYQEYSTTPDTWKNENICRIFSLPEQSKNNVSHEPFHVYLICEINIEKKEIRMLLQSEVHLSNFLRKNGNKLLTLMLERIISE